MGKLITFIVLFIAFIGFAIAANHLTVGSAHPNAVLIFQQTYNQTGIPGVIVSNNYGFSNLVRNITMFRAYDLNTVGTGGFASITNSGIGFRNVTFNLRASAFGRGYSFFVDIYGV